MTIRLDELKEGLVIQGDSRKHQNVSFTPFFVYENGALSVFLRAKSRREK